MTTYPIPRDAVTPCAADAELHFPDKSAGPKRVDAAKKVCAGCPWKDGCLEWAVATGEQGIWGETDDKERDQIRKDRGIKAERVLWSTGTANGPAAANLVAHGTPVGIEYHRRKYEPMCDVCAGVKEAREYASNDHGSPTAIRAHWRRKESLCDVCRDAYNAARKEKRRLQREATRPPRVDAFALATCEDCGKEMRPKSLPRHRREKHVRVAS